jgi:hypothetical protein
MRNSKVTRAPTRIKAVTSAAATISYRVTLSCGRTDHRPDCGGFLVLDEVAMIFIFIEDATIGQ